MNPSTWAKLVFLRLKEDAKHFVSALVDAFVDRLRRHPVLGEIYEFIDGVFGDYARDHGPIYAGALAFYAILSLIPMVVLFASVSGYVLVGNGAPDDKNVDAVLTTMRRLVPYLGDTLRDDIKAIIENRQSLGLFGIFTLVLSAAQVFRGMEFALARTFARLDHEAPSDEKIAPRGYFKSKLVFGVFATVIVLASLAVRLLSGGLRALQQALGLQEDFWGNAAVIASGNVGTPIMTAIGIVIGFAAVVFTFASHSVKKRFALLGGLVFYVVFQAMHVGYDVYISRLTNLGAMYGSFAAIFVVVLWIYFCATSLLMCFHLVKVVQRRILFGPRFAKDGSWLFVRPLARVEPPRVDVEHAQHPD
jgi:membrane protein